jgi:hypothetical protein
MSNLNAFGLPDGETFMASDRLILLEQFESAAILGAQLGKPGTEAQIHMTFIGRLNRSEETDNVTIAISPEDVPGLINTIATSLNALLQAGH